MMRLTKRTKQKGMAVFAMAVIFLMMIPMIGLAIDVSMLFITKARLQGAVDGAALAGARALARGADGSAQITSAQNAAVAYVNLNYPAGYFFSSNLNITQPVPVDLSVNFQRSITVTAAVDSPAMFEKMLGFTITTVRASATAVRRDANIMVVMDRSGSLQASGSCAPLKQSAINFVNNYFADGRDNVGLVTFASSSWIDFALANNFKSAATPITTIINNVSCAGSTSSAQGLWQGYSELVRLNQVGALNVIVFFTDGQPTGVVVDMTIKNGTANHAPKSPCDASSLPSPVIRGLYSVFVNSPQFFGLLSGSVGPQPIVNGDLVMVPPGPPAAPGSKNCNFAVGWAQDGGIHSLTDTSDFDYMGIAPNTDQDIWGNSLNTGYQGVTLDGNGHVDVQAGNPNGDAIALNAADDAGRRIRNGANVAAYGRGLNNITIFSIGLGNAAIPASPVFLQRVSNDPNSPIFDSTKPAGFYVYAAGPSDLPSAFNLIASEILRLSH